MTCIPVLSDVKGPLAVVGGLHGSQLADIGRIRVQHPTSMSGRQGGKLKPLKVYTPFNDTNSRSL